MSTDNFSLNVPLSTFHIATKWLNISAIHCSNLARWYLHDSVESGKGPSTELGREIEAAASPFLWTRSRRRSPFRDKRTLWSWKGRQTDRRMDPSEEGLTQSKQKSGGCPRETQKWEMRVHETNRISLNQRWTKWFVKHRAGSRKGHAEQLGTSGTHFSWPHAHSSWVLCGELIK